MKGVYCVELSRYIPEALLFFLEQRGALPNRLHREIVVKDNELRYEGDSAIIPCIIPRTNSNTQQIERDEVNVVIDVDCCDIGDIKQQLLEVVLVSELLNVKRHYQGNEAFLISFCEEAENYYFDWSELPTPCQFHGNNKSADVFVCNPDTLETGCEFGFVPLQYAKLEGAECLIDQPNGIVYFADSMRPIVPNDVFEDLQEGSILDYLDRDAIIADVSDRCP